MIAPTGPLSPGQQAMVALWERHMATEFAEHDADAAIATMTPMPHLNHVPVMTGATGREALRAFYANQFIPNLPPDATTELVSRTVGQDRIVDEFLFIFTHTIEIAWMLPGIAPTGRRVETPMVAIVQFRDGMIESEHIHWDQAGVLVQIGLLDEHKLPVVGADAARKLRDPHLPSNELIARFGRR